METLKQIRFASKCVIAILLALSLQHIRSQTILTRARLCVIPSDYDECLQMSAASNGTLSCVKARDRYECMKYIIDERADILNLNNEALYLAGRLYNLEPFAMEQYKGDTKHFEAVAIVNNRANINSLAELRGKRSCHGSINSTQGWDIPVGLLLATLTMEPDCRGELQSASRFFGRSCAPGPWSSDQYVDGELKRLHPELCSNCRNSTLCSSNDEFAGDEGALRCLMAGAGDVAFTSSQALDRFLASAPPEVSSSRLTLADITGNVRPPVSIADLSYLCLDGSKIPLSSSIGGFGGPAGTTGSILAATKRPCEWAHKPTNVFVTNPNRSTREKDLYTAVLRQLYFRFVPFRPSWWRMRSLFSHPQHVTQILPVPGHLQQWDKYLGNYISSIEKPLPGCNASSGAYVICTSSLLEEQKCLDLQKAAFSERIRPEIDCQRRPSKRECLEQVARRKAHLVAADLSELLELQATSSLLTNRDSPTSSQNSSPSLMEQLEPAAVGQALADYSVALVKASSNIRQLHQLGGRRSCHAHFGDTASWLAPLAVLTERSLLEPNQCDKADQMAKFFGGSCVPGAADLRVNHFRSAADRLCAICGGDATSGEHQCERSLSERYFGQEGAIRCLVEGAGEVAFVSLAALAEQVDSRSKSSWARQVPLELDSRNFRLVCRTGPAMMLNDYERCHLARMPGKMLVSNKFLSQEQRVRLRALLVKLVDKFAGPNQENLFDLFGAYQNQTDLLFDQSTSRLAPTHLDSATFDMVAKQHFDPSIQRMVSGLFGPESSPKPCKLVVLSGAESVTLRWPMINVMMGLMILSSAWVYFRTAFTTDAI